MFYKASYNVDNDMLIKTLKSYSNQEINQVKVPKPNEKENQKLNDVLAIYSLLLLEITGNTHFIDVLIKFIFLFREYLNLVGWEHNKYLYQNGLVEKLNFNGDFCSINTCEEVPELVNDFTTIFIEMDEEFSYFAKDIKDVAQNFCHWLYINELTNFKLIKLDYNQLE